MTIEEIIENLTTIRNKLCSRKYETESSLTFDSAIDIIRKYQKIVNIVSLNGEEFKQCGLKELKEILEVIADGR